MNERAAFYVDLWKSVSTGVLLVILCYILSPELFEIELPAPSWRQYVTAFFVFVGWSIFSSIVRLFIRKLLTPKSA